MSKDDGKRATLRRNPRFAIILSWRIKFKVILCRNESWNVSETNCKSYPDSRAISTYNTILDLFKQVRRTSPFNKAAGTLSFFYKQLLYKQLGSDFLKAKQFSASDLRIFSNFAGFETCYYIH